EVHVTPQMTNQLGTLSNGVLSTLITEASGRLLLHYKKGNMVVESLNIYVIEPVQMDSDLTIIPELLDAGRLYAKINAEVWNNKKLVCNGMLMAQLIERYEKYHYILGAMVLFFMLFFCMKSIPFPLVLFLTFISIYFLHDTEYEEYQANN